MIEPSLNSINIDTCGLELLNDAFCDLRTSVVGVFDFVVMFWEAVLSLVRKKVQPLQL